MRVLERVMFAGLLVLGLAVAAMAQTTDIPTEPGGGMTAEPGVQTPPDQPAQQRQTLEDILARQAGEDVPRSPRDDSAAGQAAGLGNQLGTLGGASDSEVWEALRFGTADVTVSAGGPEARVVMQDRGMWWLEFRDGRLANWGFYFWIGLLAFLGLFYLLRGRIMVSGGLSGIKVVRFDFFERFAHWLLAGSLMVLGATGLFLLFGRRLFMPLIGKENFALLAEYSKLIHNNVGWPFMIGLVLVFIFWLHHNIPRKIDLQWFAQGGGIFGDKHPPAKKFNAGQKILFWTVILLGGSVSASGIALLFPFEFHMFAWTFAKLNALGVPALFGMEAFPTQLAPHEEMQFAHVWHVLASFGLMALTTAHIYIGTVGMQGAFHAMGSGEVDLNWANDHHRLWVEEMDEETRRVADKVSPAE